VAVEEKVKEIVFSELFEQYSDPKETFESLGADSLDQVQIVMEIEDAFGITVEDEDMAKILCPQDAIDYVKDHTKVLSEKGNS
jgi:acyl carrier protein